MASITRRILNSPRLLLGIGVAWTLLIALSFLIASIGLPYLVWLVARPRGAGLEWFPTALRISAAEAAQRTYTPEGTVRLFLAINALLAISFAVLGILVAFRKRLARTLLVGLSSVVLLYLLAISAMAMSASVLLHQLDSIVTFSIVILVFTRRSVVRLFEPAQN